MDQEAERLLQWLENIAQGICSKRLDPRWRSGSTRRTTPDWSIPECWGRKDLPGEWVHLCPSCKARVAIQFDSVYPFEDGLIRKDMV